MRRLRFGVQHTLLGVAAGSTQIPPQVASIGIPPEEHAVEPARPALTGTGNGKAPFEPWLPAADRADGQLSSMPDSEEGAARTRRRVLSAAIFILGLLVAQAGLQIARSNQTFPFISDNVKIAIAPYINVGQDALVVGGLIAIAGVVMAALAARKALPDRIGAAPLPIPRLRLDPLAIVSGVFGAGAAGLLYVHLAAQQYTHWDIALFFASLFLVGLAIHRLDPRDGPRVSIYKPVDALAAIGIAAFTTAIGTIDLTKYYFAYIGDEGSFFNMAHFLVRGELGWNFFNLKGVYETHPVLDSVYQAGIMKLLGDDIVGWRMSEVLLQGVCAALMYLLATALLSRASGIAAGVILGSSYYLMAFSRIAYNNTHMLFYSILVVLMLVLAWRTQRAVFVFLTGAMMGFCLYTFLGAFLIWPIVALTLLIVFFRRPSWGMVVAGLVLVLGFAMVVTPALLTSGIEQVIRVALENSRRESAVIDALGVARISIVQSFLVHWVSKGAHVDYVGAELVDAITGLLLLAGAAISLFRINRRPERLALTWFAGGIIVQASFNYVAQPQLTRLLFVLPGAALLCAITVEKIIRVLRGNLHVPQMAAVAAPLLLIAFVPLLNVNLLLYESPPRMPGSVFKMTVKELQQYPEDLIVEVGGEEQPDGNLVMVVSWYPGFAGRYTYLPFSKLDPSSPNMLSPTGRRPIYMVDNRSQGLLQVLPQKLPGDYFMREDRDPSGSYRVWLFIPSMQPNASGS